MQPTPIWVDSADPTPIHAQIERSIRAGMATGRLPKGARLPTVRQLAVQLGVNPNTVGKVYSELERSGLVKTRRGVGTFVGQSADASPRQPGDPLAIRDFATRVLDDAAARGFSRDELIAQLQVQVKEEQGT